MVGVHGFKNHNKYRYISPIPQLPSPGYLLFTISCLVFQKISMHLQILMFCFFNKWKNNIHNSLCTFAFFV